MLTRTDRRTNKTKQIVAVRNFANAPKIMNKNEHNIKKVARPVGRPGHGWQLGDPGMDSSWETRAWMAGAY
jgi:hypothetical protein